MGLFGAIPKAETILPNTESAQRLDEKYLTLLEWAEKINQRGESWNAHCADFDESNKIVCAEVRDRIDQEIVIFLAEAKAYKSAQDFPECRGQIREHIIRHFVKTFEACLKYAGQALTEAQKLEVAVMRAWVKADTTAVVQEMQDCADSQRE